MRLKKFGPGLLVTAAFIGPGTVTTASRAGAEFGFALLWAVLFSVVATIVLQEMAARLGIVSRQGLGEAISLTFKSPTLKWLARGLVIAAIGFGNAAYQTGNVTGSAVALEVLTGIGVSTWSLIVGVGAFLALIGGGYRAIERLLIALVVLMSLAFIVTAVIARPDIASLFRGFVPRLPEGSLATVLALIGTTIVPYNLFLHASSVREKWQAEANVEQALRESRLDTVLAVTIGGLITAAIVTTASATFFVAGGKTSGLTAAEMARQLEPALGGAAARWLFAIGLLAAGLTSAVTAPLAAAYAVSGVLNWRPDLRAWRFRLVWLTVLIVGTALAARLGKSPEQTIFAAQVANGFLLPLVAAFLLIVVNQQQFMGRFTNGLLGNLAGGAIVAVVVALTAYKLWNL